MDLLPFQYKIVKRDYLAMALLALSAVAGIALSFFVFISMHTYYKLIEKSATSGITAVEADLRQAAAQESSLQGKLSSVAFDVERQISLNDEIMAFNKIGRGFRWSVFLDQLEKAMPKRIWIKALDIKKAPKFTLICESADQILPITFEQQLLLNSRHFKNVFLGGTILDKQNLAVIFRITFDFVDEGE